ncbi:lysophospholipid acyltransferase family protein [Octadecabacter sp. R77987]|uniref:lysophospholipid acyltransferase family protein n=1 Tax=Octadecabacter sp. R77987 TaxID=3093874 RepID=UPI0036700E4A
MHDNSDTSDPQGTWGQWLTNLIVRGLIGAALVLPYASRVRFLGWAVERIIAPLAGYRQRAEDQLAFIYPDMPANERRAIARRVCNNFGRTLIENYSHPAFGEHVAQMPVQGPGLAAIEQARAKRQPVIFVTGHFGNYEAPRHALNAMGYEIGALYRPMSNAFFDAHYANTMAEVSGRIFPQGRRGTMGFVRMLRDGGMGVLLFDVRSTAFDDIDFLGHPAPTATSAADIALRVNALVVPYFGTRRADGLTFDITVEDPIAHSDPVTMMQDMTARLEAHIATHKDQWFWVHKRWRK